MNTKVIPLTENQRDLLECLSEHQQPAWASKQLLRRALKDGYIQATSDNKWMITPRGKIMLRVDYEHQPHLAKRVLGASPIAGLGKIYGTSLRCRCGWRIDLNYEDPKRVIKTHQNHIDDVLSVVSGVWG